MIKLHYVKLLKYSHTSSFIDIRGLSTDRNPHDESNGLAIHLMRL